ncbi:MAG: 30S ribosomal protein S9 [archaeon]
MVKHVFKKGKKKKAVARTTVKKGKGTIKINNQPIDLYTPELHRKGIKEPIRIAKEVLGEKEMKGIDIRTNVKGGGKAGQAAATRTSIGKALVEWSGSDELEEKYREYDRSIMVDDYRRTEPKKPMRKGARAKPIKSYR